MSPRKKSEQTTDGLHHLSNPFILEKLFHVSDEPLEELVRHVLASKPPHHTSETVLVHNKRWVLVESIGERSVSSNWVFKPVWTLTRKRVERLG